MAFKGKYSGPGSKCMSGSRTGLSGKGKMSNAHGTNGQSKDNNMSRNTGGYRIGSNCRTFKSGLPSQPTQARGYPTHADQPSGHGKK